MNEVMEKENQERIFKNSLFHFTFLKMNAWMLIYRVSSQYHALTALRLNKNYIIYFHLWTWIILTGAWLLHYHSLQRVKSNIAGILPFSLLALLNWNIYFSIKRLKRSLRKDSPSPITR